MKWNPGKVIERHARAIVRAAVASIQSGARVHHRDGAQAVDAGPGGSLVKAMQKPAMVEVKPWGSIIKWASLGQKLLWLVKGTSRQKPRPIQTLPNVAKLTADLRADALAHYKRRTAA